MSRFFKGLIIGCSYVIPGVCSASTAISLKEYDNILELMGNFYKFKTVKNHLFLIFGILLGMVFAFVLVMKLFNIIPWFILTIFFIINLLNFNLSLSNFKNFVFEAIGFILLLFFTLKLTSIDVTSNIIFLFYGLIVALGFVLPGLSGSLLMFNLGIYEMIYIMFKARNFLDITFIFFLVSLVMGIIIWSKLFNDLIKKSNNIFTSILEGMFMGNLFLLGNEIVKCFSNLSTKVLYTFSIIMVGFIIKISSKHLRKKIKYDKIK